ncbi:Ubiquitin carboxyl-terminal hydrolase 20 [Fasciola hepatica]|uniref:Ubiquitin carboxyl-terminal hydrolase n=1 Tax=Fasciola hepatica TaxID=6192 RepID=A0A4E0RWN1_FASHE|nr:Ubiquitin carboxyl-terminal hydrolase 20 [Fasciola hepatica]
MMHSDSSDLQYTSSSEYVVESDKPLGAAGLRNLGNTCYMNAALQSISNWLVFRSIRKMSSFSPHLTEFLLQCPALLGDAKPRLATHYYNFLAQLWLPPGCTHSVPIPILREVQCLHPMFMGYGQHDAQEFLRVFLNRLHDELKTTNSPGSCSSPKGLKAESGDTGSTDSGFASSVPSVSCERDQSAQYGETKQKKNRQKHSPSTEETHRADADGRSIITDVFQGKLVSAVRCLSCNELSCREEPFLDLSLSLQRSETVHTTDSHLTSDALGSATFKFKSSPSHPSREPLGTTTRLVLPTDPTHVKHPSPSAKSITLAAQENSQARPSRRALPLNLWQPLSSFNYPVSLAVRLVAQLFALFAISWAWVTARMNSVRGWVYQPTLTLEDCLADYFSQAELNGDNKYSCERCKRLCNGLNQYALLSLPEVLCVHLKRFRSHYTDTSKITVAVTFPMHNLDLSPYLHEDCTDEVTTYDLISVICHHGGYGGGHYICYALNWHNQRWYEFDDDVVTEKDPDQISQLTSEAYMLFYRKRDTLLSGLRNEAELLVHEHMQRQSDRAVYISRPWSVRFNIWAEPGPITNVEFLCEHGNVQPQLWSIRDSLILPIPERLWFILSTKFGGGPIVRNPISCPKCRDAILSRQERECDAFEKIYEKDAANCNSCALYAVSTSWFNSWKSFAQGDTFKIPGPIDNTIIVRQRPLKSRFTGSPISDVELPRLKMGADYQELFESCWNLLFDIYGGGPAICVRPSAPSSSHSDDQIENASALPTSQYLGVDDKPSFTLERLAQIVESNHYRANDALDLYSCTNGSVGNTGLSSNGDSLNEISGDDLLASEYCSSSTRLKVEPEEECHLPMLTNGDVLEPPIIVKPERTTTRSAEDLSLTYLGDTTNSILNPSVCKLEKAKYNGSWYSQSLESLYFNQFPVTVPLMAGDGPVTGVNFVQSEVGFQKLSNSYRKRPRLL